MMMRDDEMTEGELAEREADLEIYFEMLNAEEAEWDAREYDDYSSEPDDVWNCGLSGQFTARY